MAINQKLRRISHHQLADLPSLLHAGDLLVVNDSLAIAASLPLHTPGGPRRAHLAARLSAHRVIVELRRADGEPDPESLAWGAPVAIPDADGRPRHQGFVTGHFHRASRFWTLDTQEDWYKMAPRYGRPIRYHYIDAPYDIAYYRTPFARIPGSSEMASASRPFTSAIQSALRERGVRFASLTLHTTTSSHEINDTTRDFPVIPEWYHIPRATRQSVEETLRSGRRVIALGTTVARALESWAQSQKSVGWTYHLITPKTPPQVTSALITGLHDSFTSHLWLLYAYVSPQIIRDAYGDALRQGYHWHEFGDLSVIFPG